MTNSAVFQLRLMEERDIGPLATALELSQRHIEARWQERLAGQRTMLVTEVDGETAGAVSFEERDKPSGLLHLFALAVASALQGRGIATGLIAGVEEEARRRGLRGVHLGVAVDNVRAITLYERLGYQRVGEPYDSRWIWYGPDGEEREMVERCYRMVKLREAARS